VSLPAWGLRAVAEENPRYENDGAFSSTLTRLASRPCEQELAAGERDENRVQLCLDGGPSGS